MMQARVSAQGEATSSPYHVSGINVHCALSLLLLSPPRHMSIESCKARASTQGMYVQDVYSGSRFYHFL